MIKRIFSMMLTFCIVLVPAVNAAALENNDMDTNVLTDIEETKNVQKADVDDALQHGTNSIARKSSISVDVEDPVLLADEIPPSGICGPNITWRLENDTLIINGAGEMNNPKYAPWYSYHEEIKYVDIEKGITSIGDSAFHQCYGLKEIHIPDSVTSIGSEAFHQCYGLKEIHIPDSVTSIGSRAFFLCNSLPEIRIPDGVTRIEDEVFTGCGSLKEVHIPDSVTSIGDEVFVSCGSLKEIHIPDSVISIGDEAFAYCGLKEIYIPDSVTSIGIHAFASCLSLKEVHIPDGITNIGGEFVSCGSLKEIYIPDSVTSIGSYAFAYCSSLKDIYIPDNVTSIGSSAFRQCSSLTNVYYAGDETSWQNIKIEDDNKCLTAAIIYYNSTVPDYKIYTSKDVSPSNGYEGFDCSLEECMAKKESVVYNPQLAHMLIAMCNSIYDETNMKATFNSFGFKDSDSVTDYNMWDGIWVGYGMAKKKLSHGQNLVLIVTRGTEEIVEWISNLNTKINIATGQHRGFSNAANGLYSKMVDFLGTGDFSNTQFVITGFSRGAAVANLLAGRLVDENVPQDKIHAYTFACPDVGLFTDKKVGSYKCIFNIANAEDIVSWVPRTILGDFWNKFGQSYWYSSTWNDYEDLEMCIDVHNIHNQAVYLKRLRDDDGEDTFDYKTRDEAKAALDDAANWRRVKFLSDVGKKILGYVGIHCPVDVEIYDVQGQLAGKITNNIVDYINSDKIYISIADSQKDIYLLDNETYTFNISAIGDGTMEYVVQNIRASDQSVVEGKTFLNVNLTEGKQMTSSVQPRDDFSEDISIQTSEVRLFVLDDNGDAKTEVLADGSGTEISVADKVENPDSPDSGDANPDNPAPGNSNTKNPGGTDNPETNQPKPAVKVEKIKISGLSHKIAAGKKIALTASVLPANATNKTIVWKTSDTKAATVNSTGVVTMKRTGKGKTVTITAMAEDGSGTKATYKIKCMNGIIKKISISGKNVKSAKAGKTIKLQATVDVSKSANKTLKWMSSNKKYATVNNKGKVTIKKAGKGKTVKITAMATDGSGKKASVKIRIK